MKVIEQNLKEICRNKGLSLTDVANRMCTSPSNLLSSVKGNPTISKLQDIADAIQISVSELLTKRPDKAFGIAIINGQTYQLSKPNKSIVQLSSYNRYDKLREDVSSFIKECIDKDQCASIMGLIETMTVFSLVYDPENAKFFLSLCYAEGKTITSAYDKYEYSDWNKNQSDDNVSWDIEEVTKEIIYDLEGRIPMALS